MWDGLRRLWHIERTEGTGFAVEMAAALHLVIGLHILQPWTATFATPAFRPLAQTGIPEAAFGLALILPPLLALGGLAHDWPLLRAAALGLMAVAGVFLGVTFFASNPAGIGWSSWLVLAPADFVLMLRAAERAGERRGT